jgi:hypothetical protein
VASRRDDAGAGKGIVSSAPVYLQSFPSANPFTINLGTTLTGSFPSGAVSGNASSPWIITNIFLQSTQSHVTNNGTITADPTALSPPATTA